MIIKPQAMPESLNLSEFIKNLCTNFSLDFEQVSEFEYKIITDEASGIRIFITFKGVNDFSFYFSERTYDVFHRGDRTDVHVITSLMFVSFLQAMGSGMTCALYDIPHPVCQDEIWGRYIMPMQVPGLSGVTTFEQIKNIITDIIYTVAAWRQMFWYFVGCPCADCRSTTGAKSTRDYDVSKEISDPLEEIYGTSESLNSGCRTSPDWDYLYDMEHEVTIIKSHELCMFIDYMQKIKERKISKVEGINGRLILDGEINSFITYESIKETEKLFSLLSKESVHNESIIIPLENMIVAASSPYVIALGRLCGVDEFKVEKELLRQRHNNEADILFPVTLFEWSDDICPDQFEKLIKVLLERESNVKSVRRPAPLNQGDKGRDLIIEWAVPNPSVISVLNPPTSVIRVVGQCKASNGTVGKNKVLDIRDTVETHGASGFFLAVSTQVSAPLTEKLEELRSKGIWTQWWNREDIESRLLKCIDLVVAYPNVLKPKNKVKYVDKED